MRGGTHLQSFQVVQTFDIHNLGVFQHGFTDANFSICQKFKMVEDQSLYSLICSTIAPREIYKELKLSFLIFNISQTLSIPILSLSLKSISTHSFPSKRDLSSNLL